MICSSNLDFTEFHLSSRGCCCDHVAGRTAIGLHTFFLLSNHGMSQIIGHPAPASCLFEKFKVHDIPLNQLNPAVSGPRPAAHFFQVASHGTHPIAAASRAGISRPPTYPVATVTRKGSGMTDTFCISYVR